MRINSHNIIATVGSLASGSVFSHYNMLLMRLDAESMKIYYRVRDDDEEDENDEEEDEFPSGHPDSLTTAIPAVILESGVVRMYCPDLLVSVPSCELVVGGSANE